MIEKKEKKGINIKFANAWEKFLFQQLKNANYTPGKNLRQQVLDYIITIIPEDDLNYMCFPVKR